MSKTSSSTSVFVGRGAGIDEYFERFFEICGEYSTYYQAFAALEDEHYRIFGRYKYSSYASFRTMKSSYLRKLRREAAERRRIAQRKCL